MILGYWDIRGLAQAIRYQLIYQGVEFDDLYHHHTHDIASRQGWLDQKFELGLDFPNLPYLLVGEDFKLTEHMAIHQFIADKWQPELLGRDDLERTKVDVLAGVLSEFKIALHLECYTEQDKAKVAKRLLLNMKDIAASLQDKDFLLGPNICYLDFYMFELMQFIDFLTDGGVFERYPHLEDYQFRIASLPRLKEYLESGQALVAPFNMKFAKLNNWSPFMDRDDDEQKQES